jgi:hypothetical protein
MTVETQQFDLFAPSAVTGEQPAAGVTCDIAPKNGLDQLGELYASRTEADFAHMEQKLSEIPADQPLSPGAALAGLFLAVRAMERAETLIGPLGPDTDPVHWLVIGTRIARSACGIIVSAYDRQGRQASPSDGGEQIRCTHDFHDGTVTCPRCIEVVS